MAYFIDRGDGAELNIWVMPDDQLGLPVAMHGNNNAECKYDDLRSLTFFHYWGEKGQNMPGMRSQGRPIRDAAVGGKEAILHGVRDFIRSNAESDISRKGIANFLNVTPALISYYFPDRNELLESATAPILKDIADHVDDIVSVGDPPLSILKMMIRFYVECHINEGGIIQCFSDLVVKSEHYRGPDYTSAIRGKTKDFINKRFPNDSKSSYKLKFISWNLWSLCRLIIIETPTAADAHGQETIPEPSAVQYADRIYTLLTDGVGLDKFAIPPRFSQENDRLFEAP